MPADKPDPEDKLTLDEAIEGINDIIDNTDANNAEMIGVLEMIKTDLLADLREAYPTIPPASEN